MSCCISHMFGIRTGGVFSGRSDVDDMRKRITGLILERRGTPNDPDMGGEDGDPSHCMSQELEGHKGSYVVLAGVFNYWNAEQGAEFASALSREFGTDVMHMCWNEVSGRVSAEVWTEGVQSHGNAGGIIDSIRQTVRRVT